MKSDQSLLEVLQALLENQRNVPKEDKDSFATFTSGLRNNWVFVMALIGLSTWLISNINSAENINSLQDTQIAALTQSTTAISEKLEEFKTEIQDQFKTNDSTNSELLRRIDLVQKDIEILKFK